MILSTSLTESGLAVLSQRGKASRGSKESDLPSGCWSYRDWEETCQFLDPPSKTKNPILSRTLLTLPSNFPSFPIALCSLHTLSETAEPIPLEYYFIKQIENIILYSSQVAEFLPKHNSLSVVTPILSAFRPVSPRVKHPHFRSKPTSPSFIWLHVSLIIPFLLYSFSP